MGTSETYFDAEVVDDLFVRDFRGVFGIDSFMREESVPGSSYEKAVSKNIGDLKSSVSELALNTVGENSIKEVGDSKIVFSQKLLKIAQDNRVLAVLDTQFQGSFIEGTSAYLLEGDINNIESEISILQEKIKSIPLSDREVEDFKSMILQYRYGIYHFHTYIWSAYKSGKHEEIDKTVGLSKKLISEVKVELAVLLHKFGITETLHPDYLRNVALDGAVKRIESFSHSGGDFRLPGGFTPDKDIIKH